jgi:hypothetical protein
MIFYVLYLKSCIWPGGDFPMDPTKERHQILCKSLKSVTETLPMIRQVLGEERMGCT